jgi:hypothetical protein
MHKLAQNVDWKHDVRTGDGEVDETPNESSKRAWIRKEITMNIIKLQILFHGKSSGTSTKMATVSKDVKNIFALIQEYTSGRMSNLESEKVF